MIVDPGTILVGQARARVPESDSDRASRVRRIAELVKNGAYSVQSRRLAAALLDWDPRRGSPKGSVEVADRRRTYMRDYMRRRRAARHLQPTYAA